MPAGIADEARKRELIEPDEGRAESRPGVLRQGPGQLREKRRTPANSMIVARPLQAACSACFFSIWPIASTTASKVSMVEAWRAL